MINLERSTSDVLYSSVLSDTDFLKQLRRALKLFEICLRIYE